MWRDLKDCCNSGTNFCWGTGTWSLLHYPLSLLFHSLYQQLCLTAYDENILIYNWGGGGALQRVPVCNIDVENSVHWSGGAGHKNKLISSGFDVGGWTTSLLRKVLVQLPTMIFQQQKPRVCLILNMRTLTDPPTERGTVFFFFFYFNQWSVFFSTPTGHTHGDQFQKYVFT